MQSLRYFVAACCVALLSLLPIAPPAGAVFLCNNAWSEIDSTGTGSPVNLGAALDGAQTIADCGITNGQSVRYRIFDSPAWEVGTGTFTDGTPDTLSRTVIESSNSDTAINLTAAATVIISPLKGDLPSESTPIEATPTLADYAFILQGGSLERSTLTNIVALGGDVDGPGSSTDNALARFDGTGGKTLQNSTFILDDAGFLQLLGTNTSFEFTRGSADATGTDIHCRKTRNADPTLHTVVQQDDDTCTIYFKGSDGTNFENAANIGVFISAAPGNNDMPGSLVFRTTPDASVTPAERFRISHFGGFGIAGGNYGTAGQAFISGGSAAAPAWTTINGRETLPLFASGGTVNSAGAITPCALVTSFDSGSNDVFIQQCSFSATVDMAHYWTISPPKRVNESVDLTATVDWTGAVAGDATDDVIWTFACVAFGNDDAINGNAFPTVDTVTDTLTTAGDFLRSGEITTIVPAGTWTEGDALVCRLTRDADAAGDNYNGTAELLQVNLHFTVNAPTDD